MDCKNESCLVQPVEMKGQTEVSEHTTDVADEEGEDGVEIWVYAEVEAHHETDVETQRLGVLTEALD